MSKENKITTVLYTKNGGKMTKKLSELSLDELNENYVVIINIECGYDLGFMDHETAEKIFGEYDSPFPLDFEPVIPPEREDMIAENKVVSVDKVKRNIYEEVFDENNTLKSKYKK